MCQGRGVGSVVLSAVALCMLVTPTVVRSTETAHVYASMYVSPFLNPAGPAIGFMDLNWYHRSYPWPQQGYEGIHTFDVYCDSDVLLWVGFAYAPGLPKNSASAWVSPALIQSPGARTDVGLRIQVPMLPPGEHYVGRVLVYEPSHPPGTVACFPLLPTSTGDDGWQFGFTVGDAADPVFIDPLVAIGYDYLVDAGPTVASVLLPSVGDNQYDLWLWDDDAGDWMDAGVALTGGSPYDFAVGGVSRFRILGIEAAAGLDPLDDTAFVTGLWFTSTGRVTLRQVPLSFDTEVIPAPGALVLSGIGLVLLRRMRRRLA